MKIFQESNGVFSWRKAGTALIFFLFAFVVIGFEFGLVEIPGSYQGIIAMVFAFYFAKEALRNAGKVKTLTEGTQPPDPNDPRPR